jgi:hypothetical protein
MYALKSILTDIKNYLVNKLELLNESDFPDRPNQGKWIIDYGYKRKKNHEEKLLLSYNLFRVASTGTSFNLRTEIWCNPLGKQLWKTTNTTNIDNIIALIYTIHKKYEIEPQTMSLIPDLVKYGFLKKDNNSEKAVNIPIINKDEHNIILKITNEYTNRFIETISDRLIEYIMKNKLKSPKNIKPVSSFVHLCGIMDIAMMYLYKANETGLIKIDKNKSYPLWLMIEDTVSLK